MVAQLACRVGAQLILPHRVLHSPTHLVRILVAEAALLVLLGMNTILVAAAVALVVALVVTVSTQRRLAAEGQREAQEER